MKLVSEEWKKNKMNGKFKDAAGYGMAKKGYIAFRITAAKRGLRTLR